MAVEDLRVIGDVLYERRSDGMLYPVRRVAGGLLSAPTEDQGSATGIPELDRMLMGLGNVNQMFNPVEGIGQSMAASRRMLAPDTAGMDRVAAFGDMLSGVAGVTAPVAAAARAGTPAAVALMEGLLGGSPAMTAAKDTARTVARTVAERANQRGPVPVMGSNLGNLLGDTLPAPRNEAEAIAKDILELRATGNVDAVTESMMNAADPQYMYNYTPLPMDQASRMARAAEMGLPTEAYHGTPYKDIVEMKPSEFGAVGPGIYAATNPVVASDYARGYGLMSPKNTFEYRNERYTEGGNVMPIQIPDYLQSFSDWTTTKMADMKRQGLEASGYRADAAASKDAKESGFKGVQARAGNAVIFDPENIRSRFARFDPMFAHLRNLSSGVAISPLAYGLLSDQYERENRQ